MPVVDFWQVAIRDPEKLAESVSKHHKEFTKEKFSNLQKAYEKERSKIERAAIFFVLNRSSFNGTTLSGGMTPGHPRFTKSCIERLRQSKLKNLSVNYADFSVSIKNNPNTFLYLDPPYANDKKLYGKWGDMHVNFNDGQHEKLAEILKKRAGWLLSYNDCQKIRKLYKDYEFITPSWAYGMNINKLSSEVLILG